MRISRIVATVLTATSLQVSSVHAQQVPAADGQSEGARTIQAIVTGYANGGDAGAVGGTTATGVETHWGVVAADWRLYPPGTRLQIEGFPNDVFTVEDSGGGVHDNVFDIWFPDLATASAFGTKSLRVTVLP